MEEERIQDFLNWCRIRNVKEHTIEGYKWILRQFLTLTKGETEEDVIFYKETMRNSNNKESTISKKLIVVKLWFKFNNKMNIYEEIKVGRPERKLELNSLVTKQDLNKLLLCVDKLKASKIQKLRDRAFIEFLYWTGCRLGEILNVKMIDITKKENGIVFKVDGKTGKREVFVLFKDILFLNLWIEKNKSKWLFPSVRYHLADKPMSDVVANFILHNLQKHINKRLHAHLFRHSAATRMAKEGFNESFMRHYFGWSQRSNMPSYYTHLVESDIEEIMLRKEKVIKETQTIIFKPNKTIIQGLLQDPEVREIIKQEMGVNEYE